MVIKVKYEIINNSTLQPSDFGQLCLILCAILIHGGYPLRNWNLTIHIPGFLEYSIPVIP